MDFEKTLFPSENPHHSNKWISGRKLISRWGIMGFELFGYMKQGLQAYTWYGRKIGDIDSDTLEREPPQPLEHFIKLSRGVEPATRILGAQNFSSNGYRESERIKSAFESQTLKVINPPKGSKLISFTIPEDEKKAADVISGALSFLFKMEDVLTFEREHGLVSQESQVHPSPPAIRPSQNDGRITERTGPLSKDQVISENYFIRDTNVWQIGFGEEKGSILDYAYIRCVVMLLNKPGEAIPCIELYHIIKGNPTGKGIMTDNQVMAEGLNSPNFVQRVNTNKTRREYEKALEFLYEKKATFSDPEDLDEFNFKINKIETALKERPMVDKNYKMAQNNIRHHIKNACTAIEKKAKMKRLSKHLSDNIKPGGAYDYCYRDTKTPWEISL